MKLLHRFTALDGLRGLAALIVFIRHTPDFWGFTVYRSYLAVDLFFLLSGFVIAYAYDDKLTQKLVSLKDFLIIRVIRLYPVFFLSILLSVSVFVVKALVKHEFPEALNLLIPSFLFTCFLLPYKIPQDYNSFPLNPPYWSLFFEMLVNLIYACWRPFIKLDHLKYYIAGFALVVSVIGFIKGDLDVGCVWGGIDFVGGLFRALFGIFTGLLLYKNIGFLHQKLARFCNPWAFLLLTLIILASPDFGKLNPLMDIFSVLILFPLSVISISQLKESRFDKTFFILGAASYPLYVLHFPASKVAAFLTHHKETQYAPFSGIALGAILLVLSFCLERYIDTPFRKWLSARLIQKKS